MHFLILDLTLFLSLFQFLGDEMFFWRDRNYNYHPLGTLGQDNCNRKAPTWKFDTGDIDNKSLLPITGFKYGPLLYEAEKAKFTIGPLTCHPLSYEEQYNITAHVFKLQDRIEILEDLDEQDRIKRNVARIHERLAKVEKIVRPDCKVSDPKYKV